MRQQTRKREFLSNLLSAELVWAHVGGYESGVDGKAATLGICRGGQRYDFIALAIDKSHRNLNANNPMLAGKIDCLLRMLKIESVERIRSPIP
jgi:hypothetical protein